MQHVEDDESDRRKGSEHEPWAKLFGGHPQIPMSRKELRQRGCCIRRGVDKGLAKKKVYSCRELYLDVIA